MASGGGGRRRAKTRARARGKAKKTKYLSLSDLIIKVEAGTPPPPVPGDEREAEPAPQQWEEAEVKQEEEEGGGDGPDGGAAQQQQQMEPFALQHEAASTLFAALPAPSLSDILGGGAGDGGSPSPSPSASPSGLPGGAEEEEGLALARRALRGRERWVYCSAGSSPAATTATATTNNSMSSSSPCSSAASTGASARSLLLKLDYEDILAAWADRGPLFIGGGGAEAPEPQEIDAVLVEVEPSERAAAAWGATEAVVAAPTRPGRAERVRRYKEKRRNRLFAKRIRYEVRRVNAVKRPRFKGRFIREHEESELQPT